LDAILDSAVEQWRSYGEIEDDDEYGAAVEAIFDALPADLMALAVDPRVVVAPVVFAARSVAQAVRYAVEGLVMARMEAA
jgi:hypothetical protein